MRGFSRLIAAAALLLLASCGEGGSESSGGGSTGDNSGGGSGGVSTPPQDFTAPALESLSSAEVGKIVAQAAAQAQAESTPAVIAVTDRVGNVLAVFEMTGAPTLAQIPKPPSGAMHDVQGAQVPATAAAIAKALTGAYLSSGGNAFSSRTASMIVQEHFPPAPSTVGLESGPLFGVQFSQLPCSDFSSRYMAAGASALIGPKRSPLGLSADPGGFPLYKDGVLVGAVGVVADGVYGLDPNVLDVDSDVDERIALAGTVGFEAPEEIRANMIPVDGTQLRFSDAEYAELADVGGATFASTSPALGMLKTVNGYYPIASLLAGTAYGSEASGIRRATAAEFSNNEAFVLSDGAGANRYPVRAGTDAAEVGAALTTDEVRTILEQAFMVMSHARAQIRRPLDSRAQVSVSVVDTRGVVLGIVRAPDAPLFGIDVSLQKARTASFFSHPGAGAELLADPSADVRHFVPAVRTFLNDQTALTGTFAFADRSGGNLSRPYFPDGEVGRPHGPLSRPIEDFNPFSTGLQSALVLANILEHVQFIANGGTDTAHRCTKIPDVVAGQNRLHNGIQIFPGSVPVYRNGVLVGGVGVSGDGIDQDDMISFLGVHNAGQALGTLGNAPVDIRADNIVVTLSDGKTVRLRFVNCPFAPFLDTSEQNVCEGF
ncbi:MAG: heme-binding protein [Novosphingobium sp.]|nr:heme-binding protein [Novosphingobium sp.]